MKLKRPSANDLANTLRKKTMVRVSRWIRTGKPELSDREVQMGINELEHAQNTLLCMDGYFLAARVITGDLESLRELKYLREVL
jgi:hypothetical protein